jgi:hypothetical protein
MASGLVQELFTAVTIGVNGSNTFPDASGLGVFVCTVTGTFDADVNGNELVDGFPVTAGSVYGFGLACAGELVITLSGGAAGTVGVAQ